MSRRREGGLHEVFEGVEDRAVLEETFYKRTPAKVGGRRRRKRKPKATHYEVICISLYNEDLERLDAKVKRLKEAGHRKMSRSALIRYALDTVDLEALPRSY